MASWLRSTISLAAGAISSRKDGDAAPAVDEPVVDYLADPEPTDASLPDPSATSTPVDAVEGDLQVR